MKMSDVLDLIRFLVGTEHPYLALGIIFLLALYGLSPLMPIHVNFGLSVGDRQEGRHDKAS